MKSKADKKKDKILIELEKANVTDFDNKLLEKEFIMNAFDDCIKAYNEQERNNVTVAAKIFTIKGIVAPLCGSHSLVKPALNSSVFVDFKVSKTDALQFLSAFILGMVTNPKLGFFKAAFSFITKKIYYLNHEDRCLYLFIVEYAEKNKINVFSIEGLREAYFASKCDNLCPYFSTFECYNKNRESKELCGFYAHSFPFERVVFDLVKLNAIEYNSEKGMIHFKVYS